MKIHAKIISKLLTLDELLEKLDLKFDEIYAITQLVPKIFFT